MGKTVRKNQQSRKAVKSVYGGSYVVRGKRFTVPVANTGTIAADMAENGYRDGATVRYNGGEYRLTRDHFGDFSLERIA